MRTHALLLLPIAALVGLAGCATNLDLKPAVCDGEHRRPANPYGSVLPSVPLPEQGAGQGTPPPAAKPPANLPDAKSPASSPSASLGPLSAINPKSLRPCGRSA